MSDEIRELRSEIIALKEINGKLKGENTELTKKIDQLTKEIDKMKTENSQQNCTDESIFAISTLNSAENASNDFDVEVKPKPLAERFVPNWLIEVLAWINRIEMAKSSLSSSSLTFKQLCWPKLHLNVKPYKIMRLEFSPARSLLKRGWNNNAIPIPIASIPPPEYIVGIRGIELKFLDDQVVNFIQNIAHFLQNCHIRLCSEITMISWKMNIELIATMQALMKCFADKIFKLEFFNGWNSNNAYKWQLNNFNQLYPEILDDVGFLYFSHQSILLKHSDNIDIILNWLTKQSNNGKQKIIHFTYQKKRTALINAIKMEFCNSNSPSNFLICFVTNGFKQEFTLENAQTNEILALYRQGFLYLARYPKGEEQWKKDWNKKIYQEHETFINIEV